MYCEDCSKDISCVDRHVRILIGRFLHLYCWDCGKYAYSSIDYKVTVVRVQNND